MLELDGKVIGDSTRIIEALERSHPEPALYPPDPQARRRALELEDFFDEELGPYTRLLIVHHMLPDRDLMLGAFVPDATRVRRLVARATYPLIARRVIADFGIDDLHVEHAFQKVHAAGKRFQAELQSGGYLGGDGFTVADLTLAALVAPVVAPEQFPYPQPQRGHPRVAPVVQALAEYGLPEWAREVYRRHRGASAEIATTPGMHVAR